MRVVVMTRLFPNAREPLWAPFNRQQFGALGQLTDVQMLATVPWFPGARFFPGSMAGRLVDVPDRDHIAGLAVRHPRYVRPPVVGHSLAAAMYAASLLPLLARERKRYDVILSAWAYPDGTAAVALGKLLGLPVVIKVHGGDINTLATRPGIRENLRWALPRAAGIVAVSRPLAERVVAMGVPAERVSVIMDGIDPVLFRPRDQAASRRALGMPEDGKLIVFVGNLLREKGVIDLLEAFAALAARRADATLIIVGDGKVRREVDERAAAIAGRVRVLGARPHAEVAEWIGACDLLTLPSWNEGTPNVLLEALASGRPVVMSNVGGIPDLVTDRLLGELVPPREPAQLAAALDRVLDAPVVFEDIARLGARGDWLWSARLLLEALEAAVARRRMAAGSSPAP